MSFVANLTGFSAVRLRFDKATQRLKVGTFFETQCIMLLLRCEQDCTITGC